MIFRQIQVDDPHSPALSPPGHRHAGLAQAPATDEKITSLRFHEQFILERPELLILDKLRELARKQRGFDERERHEEEIQCTPVESSVNMSAECEYFEASEEDGAMIGSIVAAQRGELEEEIAGLETEAERVAEEARELAGEEPF